jgi:beta-glucosidase
MGASRRFLWGASVSAFQTEGNNIASDWWDIGRSVPMLEEPAGDADDVYHRFDEDIRLLAQAGLNAYRFSIEWARIEPEDGHISQAEIDHYQRVVDSCAAHGVQPVVTLHHFTNPRWVSNRGGWMNEATVQRFIAYVCSLESILTRPEITYAITINEPNQLSSLVALMNGNGSGIDAASGMPLPDPTATQHLLQAHRGAVDVLREFGKQAGWSIASQVMQTADGSNALRAETPYEHVARRELDFLEASRDDDFVGVQAYTRHLVDSHGPLPVPQDARRTGNGWEYYPAALGEAVQDTWHFTGKPVLITENGIATDRDSERIGYITEALNGLRGIMQQGEEPPHVLGYLHWSLLDNYEWGSYKPKFGLIAVDRAHDFRRTPKSSLAWLGRVAGEHPDGLAGDAVAK